MTAMLLLVSVRVSQVWLHYHSYHDESLLPLPAARPATTNY